MAFLTEIIAKIAALLVAAGVPAPQSTLFALILIYLLVSGLIAGLLVNMLMRRRNREHQRIVPPSDREV